MSPPLAPPLPPPRFYSSSVVYSSFPRSFLSIFIVCTRFIKWLAEEMIVEGHLKASINVSLNLSRLVTPRYTSLAPNNLNPVTPDESSSSASKKSVAFLLGHRKITKTTEIQLAWNTTIKPQINGNSFLRQPPLRNILLFLVAKIEVNRYSSSPHFLNRLISSFREIRVQSSSRFAVSNRSFDL